MGKIKRLTIRTKLNLIFAALFLTVMVAVTLVTIARERSHMLEMAEAQVVDLTTWYFDSLNTMMLTDTMDQRSILRNKILAREAIIDARVVRGDPVRQQFGPGFSEEAALDELDRRALLGEQVIKVEQGPGGRMLTVLTPFRATENTRGVNCLRCHQVKSGAINGAIRVSYSLKHMDEATAQVLQHYFAINLSLFGIGFLLANLLLRRWITQPLQVLMAVINKRAEGDVNARVDIDTGDEMGQLGESFNLMAENINSVTVRERESAALLQKKVNNLLGVMRKVTEGDFSARVGFGGQDAIGELATSLQTMIDFLHRAMEEKKQTVEQLQEKVGNILRVVTAVGQGNLTGQIKVHGNDAIDQLARGVQGMINSLNQLVLQIQGAGVQVASTATEISTSMGQLEASAMKHAEATDQVASTATEISATTWDLVSTMDEVAGVAEQASDTAVHSHAGLARMEAMMRELADFSSLVADKLDTLSEKASGIGTVVTTIGKVADQTNLLSLNASIEAEKAGDYGRGFAVVAAEIRRLADQTAVSTLDIEQMIQEMQGSVALGVDSMKGFTGLVQDAVTEVQTVSQQQSNIINQVEALGPRFETVRQAMHFQSQGGEQINEAMVNLSDNTQQAVKSLQLVKHEVQKLTSSARALHSGVSSLRVAPPNPRKPS